MIIWNFAATPVRTVRGVFTLALTSSKMDPNDMMAEVERVLLMLNIAYAKVRFFFGSAVAFSHVAQLTNATVGILFQIDTFVVSFTYNSTLESVTMEIEVVKIWLLSVYGVKLRRVSGSTWLYKQLYTNIIQAMKIE